MSTPGPHANTHIPNHLVWGILTTLFCCLPLGIVSIVYAAQVDGKRAAGDIAGAWEASEKARYWAHMSASAVAVLVILWALVFGGVTILGFASV